jgi:hypothetical protein
MAIPTAFDGKLGEIDDLANSIMTQLRVMRFAAGRDRGRMRTALRERLQSYASLVMATADEISE